MPMTELFTLGRDAELRTTPSGMSVCNLSLAYHYGQKDPGTGKKPTQWVDGALWGKRAEAMAQYLRKGAKIVATVEDLHIQSFRKADGTDAQKLAGNLIALTFAGSPQQTADAPPPPPKPAPPPAKTGFDDMDADIPF